VDVCGGKNEEKGTMNLLHAVEFNLTIQLGDHGVKANVLPNNASQGGKEISVGRSFPQNLVAWETP